VAIKNALELQAARRRASSSGLLSITKCVLHIHTHCYFAASDQNFDVAIRFSDCDFLMRAVIWRSGDVLRYDLDL